MACSDWGTDKCTGGSCFESSHYAGFVCANAFDNNTSTLWGSDSDDTAWLGYEFSGAENIEKISITSHDSEGGDRSPTHFEVRAANSVPTDGSSEGTVLLTVEEAGDLWGETTTESWEFANSNSYTCYWIYMYDKYGSFGYGCEYMLDEVEMFECQDSSSSSSESSSSSSESSSSSSSSESSSSSSESSSSSSESSSSSSSSESSSSSSESSSSSSSSESSSSSSSSESSSSSSSSESSSSSSESSSSSSESSSSSGSSESSSSSSESSSSSSESSSSSSSSESSSSSSESSSSSSESSSSSSSSESSSSSSSSESSSSSSESSSSSSSSESSSSSSSSESSSSSSSSESSSSSSESSSSSSSSESSSSSSSSESSSSSSSTPSGEVCWGYDTGVEEDNVRDWAGNWTGTGAIVGSGDNETLVIGIEEAEESETWKFGVGIAKIIMDKYPGEAGGPAPTVEYKTGNSKANCEADSWHTYNGHSFNSLGWIKVRISR